MKRQVDWQVNVQLCAAHTQNRAVLASAPSGSAPLRRLTAPPSATSIANYETNVFHWPVKAQFQPLESSKMSESPRMSHPAVPPLSNIGGQNSFEPLLTAEQAARILGGIHPKTLMRMARRREVPAIKLGRYWFFRTSALNAWVEVSSTGPCVPCQKERS